MGWTDFDLDSALERDVLQRALPLVSTASDGSQRVSIDMATGHGDAALHFTETLGATPGGCVDLLGLRPLLTGAAWKVLDLLLEAALDEVGESPNLKRGWSIDRKLTHAGLASGQPAVMSTEAWAALMNTYVATSDLRHSLVHRRVHTDASNSLVGVDSKGSALRPLTWHEQEALARAVMRASEIVTGGRSDDRAEADLRHHLSVLSSLHGVPMDQAAPPEVVPEITVIIDADPEESTRYVLDLKALGELQPFKAARFADLIVRFRDRPGQDLRGRLEEAPDGVLMLDADRPPAWFTR